MTGELTMQLLSSFSPRFNGLFECIEGAEMDFFVFHSDMGLVASLPIYGDPSLPAFSFPAVAAGDVLRVRGGTKVADPVVGRVTVDVVDLGGYGFAMDEQPRQAMGAVRGAFDPDHDVAVDEAACGLPGVTTASPGVEGPLGGKQLSRACSMRENASSCVEGVELVNQLAIRQFSDSHRTSAKGSCGQGAPAASTVWGVRTLAHPRDGRKHDG